MGTEDISISRRCNVITFVVFVACCCFIIAVIMKLLLRLLIFRWRVAAFIAESCSEHNSFVERQRTNKRRRRLEWPLAASSPLPLPLGRERLWFPPLRSSHLAALWLLTATRRMERPNYSWWKWQSGQSEVTGNGNKTQGISADCTHRDVVWYKCRVYLNVPYSIS